MAPHPPVEFIPDNSYLITGVMVYTGLFCCAYVSRYRRIQVSFKDLPRFAVYMAVSGGIGYGVDTFVNQHREKRIRLINEYMQKHPEDFNDLLGTYTAKTTKDRMKFSDILKPWRPVR